MLYRCSAVLRKLLNGCGLDDIWLRETSPTHKHMWVD